ncbi:putative V-type sodium ATP synthase subunit I domain protein [Chlamydia psittaci 84-8471/1]|nr:putative V-type sodium ATP synthase subunit I domain protein [Chlamydia psittaci 84-8471/1]
MEEIAQNFLLLAGNSELSSLFPIRDSLLQKKCGVFLSV